MAKRIHKYKLDTVSQQIVMLPPDATILSVAEQDGNIVLYALVNTRTMDHVERRNIFVFGTGHTFSGADVVFIGTVKLRLLMFHIFEEAR